LNYLLAIRILPKTKGLKVNVISYLWKIFITMYCYRSYIEKKVDKHDDAILSEIERS